MTVELLDRKQRLRHQRGQDRIFYASPSEVIEILMVRGGAGSYPDNPSRRMAWDADGTVPLLQNTEDSDPAYQLAGSEATNWNRENMATIFYFGTQTGFPASGGDDGFLYHIFPELRELDGLFATGKRNGGNNITTIHTSGDTTNGQDGTWTQRSADLPGDTGNPPGADHYRDNITSFAVSNVRGVRWAISHGGQNALGPFHVYGEISAGETPDRLLWFDQVAGLEFAKPLDYGDVPRGSAEDFVTFLKNNSSSLTASSVQVTAEDLFGGSGAWFTFDEGTGFTATLALASSIANGANSPNITIRRITPDAGQLGVHVARAYANVGSWA